MVRRGLFPESVLNFNLKRRKNMDRLTLFVASCVQWLFGWVPFYSAKVSKFKVGDRVVFLGQGDYPYIVTASRRNKYQLAHSWGWYPQDTLQLKSEWDKEHPPKEVVAPTEKKPEFKTGDKVRICAIRPKNVENRRGEPSWANGMDETCGEIGEVSRTWSEFPNWISVNVGSVHFAYRSEWLEKVEETPVEGIKVGDIVVCVNSKGMDLLMEGKEYVVEDPARASEFNAEFNFNAECQCTKIYVTNDSKYIFGYNQARFKKK